MHKGLDVATRTGTPIIAPADGLAIFSGREGGFGNMLAIDHGYGIVTKYAHCSTIDVKIGQKVKRGDIIARVGNTGRSTGPHLHYEVAVNGVAVNPSRYILN
jgi:murein DD-endopeptidase MepM/ murein hydrolase activator NlpD